MTCNQVGLGGENCLGKGGLCPSTVPSKEGGRQKEPALRNFTSQHLFCYTGHGPMPSFPPGKGLIRAICGKGDAGLAKPCETELCT